ncbi:hypothetical protein LP415_17725 [Polaromonas sp. P1(28)-8]|nr:hypothetical protein LP415_17725 [Polaromonas sp. P1(28)-8]
MFGALPGMAWQAWSQNQTENPSVECLSQLKGDAKIQILADKIPFDITKSQSLEVLANKAKPTAKEKAALSFFVTEGERCTDLGADWREKNFPAEINALLTAYRVDMVAAFADLYAGKTSYGDLAKLRAKGAAELKISVDAVVRELQAKRTAEQQNQQEAEARKNQADTQARERREMNEQQQRFAQQQAEQQQQEARRQAALQMLMNQRPSQPYQLPMPTPIPRSQTTNCTTLGNQMNCTTR